MPEPQVTIFLTHQDAELFKSFNQFHKTFELLCKSGAFDIRGGSFTCHIDDLGNVQRVERNDSLFDARRKLSTS
jgi:hypothetical protein